MKLKHLIPTLIIIFLLSFGTYWYVSYELDKVPFKTYPQYELTAYFDLQDQEHYNIRLIKGRLYATIAKNGYCKIIQKYEDRMIFNHLKLSDKNIKDLNQYFVMAPLKQDQIYHRTGRPISYSGPLLRLDYKNDSIVKSIYFENTNDSIYNRVFEEIYEFTIKTKYNTFLDTLVIKQMRYNMLESIRNDLKVILNWDLNRTWKISE
jgi:hypothetical protein